MDSEHRHELKQNELAEGLTHLPQLLKDNANMIIGLALIALALITWPMLSRKSQEKAIASQSAVAQSIQLLQAKDVRTLLLAEDPEKQSDASNALLANADTLLANADSTDNPDLTALALVKAAQAYRTELLIRQDDADSETMQTQVNKAKDAYQKALDVAVEPTLKGMATLGLGLCHEELGEADQASTLYQSIVDDESLAATVLPKQAQMRLDGLADNAEIVTFVEAPEEPVVEEAPVVPMQLPNIPSMGNAVEATETVKDVVEEKATEVTPETQPEDSK